jgi:protein TonB
LQQTNKLESKNSIIGYLVSLLLHLLVIAFAVYFIHKNQNEEATPPPPPKGQQLKLSDFNAPPPMPSQPQQQKPQTKPQQKQTPPKPKAQEPKVVKEKIPLAKEPLTKQKEQNTTKQEPAKRKEEQAQTQQPKPAEPAHKQTSAPSSSGSSLLDALNTEVEKDHKQEVGAPIKKLYGKEFDQMTPAQQKFIQDNLSGIGRITQQYLRYPEIAGKMNISGQNVVEFTLYPNGDISDLKLYKDSGYEVLDGNSLKTVKEAYKDYPRPSQPTKIRIFVRYSIY